MKNWITAIVILIIFMAIAFFLGKGCNEEKDTDISQILKAIEQNNENITEINASIALIIVKQDSIIKQRILHQTFNKYEIAKMDSFIALDSNNVNAVIRARLQALSQLSGFYDITVDADGVREDTVSTTRW